MSKIIFTADALIIILKKIFDDEELDTVVQSDREDWKGKKLSEILNLDYYSYRHKAPLTSTLLERLIIQEPKLKQIGMLDVLKRSFCLVSLDSVQRLYSKDIDQIACNATLEFWLQSEKVKLLEALIESANIALCGVKLPIEIQGENRKISLFFEIKSTISEGQTEIGESSIVTVGITLMMAPNTVDYGDYLIEFYIDESDQNSYIAIPVSSFQINSQMVSKAIPLVSDTSKNNNINLSNATVFVLTFEGYSDCKVVEIFIRDVLSRSSTNFLTSEKADNNKIYSMRLTRKGIHYLYKLRLKDYQCSIKNDTNPESHIVTLVTGE